MRNPDDAPPTSRMTDAELESIRIESERPPEPSHSEARLAALAHDTLPPPAAYPESVYPPAAAE